MMMMKSKRCLRRNLIVWISCAIPGFTTGFLSSSSNSLFHRRLGAPPPPSSTPIHSSSATTTTRLYFFNGEDYDRDEAEIEEEARVKILQSRRYQIRSVLKSAEAARNTRLQNGWVPELDEETGQPIRSEGKFALSVTAFCVAAGAIALRIGGRAALVSAVGLDFATDNPELKDNLEQILNASDDMDLVTKLLLFTAGWTAVKVLCFDFGGIVLALASGILFGGVLQGAFISAAAATFGSSVAFSMAKLDTPVRKKALEVLDEYPSLRGIEKVVAEDGLKAILTLRLAPILPIPIGMYNYVYGVTSVPYFDFAAGIFLGSLKPYLLDSYLGYFGKTVIEGTADGSGFQDMLLLGALGLSVLIGVFASQLAGETWDSVLEEVKAEKKAKLAGESEDGETVEDGLTREFMGWTLPNWMVNAQKSWASAEDIVNGMILQEYNAKVWNYTQEEGGPPADKDPASLPYSPEVTGAIKGVDLGESLYVGLVLSPLLFQSFTKYSDPLFKGEGDDDDEVLALLASSSQQQQRSRQPQKESRDYEGIITTRKTNDSSIQAMTKKEEQLLRLRALADKVKARIELIDERIKKKR